MANADTLALVWFGTLALVSFVAMLVHVERAERKAKRERIARRARQR
jgi:hypothetical protein